MNLKVPLIYLDTSVYGGCFDAEFERESKLLIEQIKGGLCELLVSGAIVREINYAPERVRHLFVELGEYALYVDEVDAVIDLRDAYIEAGVLSRQEIGDAEHIAYATVANADMIVSWNFKHIVNFRRIKGFQGVNLQYGYRPIDIYSPREVIYGTE